MLVEWWIGSLATATHASMSCLENAPIRLHSLGVGQTMSCLEKREGLVSLCTKTCEFLERARFIAFVWLGELRCGGNLTNTNRELE